MDYFERYEGRVSRTSNAQTIHVEKRVAHAQKLIRRVVQIFVLVVGQKMG